MFEVDLDNLTMEIRKATPKYYRRAKIWVKKGKARIIITNEEAWDYHHYGVKAVATIMNHEFLHWILCLAIGHKWGLKKYDKFLERQGLYSGEACREMWI